MRTLTRSIPALPHEAFSQGEFPEEPPTRTEDGVLREGWKPRGLEIHDELCARQFAVRRELWEAHIAGRLSFEDLEKHEHRLQLELRASAALYQAEKLKRRAAAAGISKGAPRISKAEQKKYDAQLPWKILSDGLSKAERRVLATLRAAAGTEQEVKICYAELAARARVSRRWALAACAKLRWTYITWTEVRRTRELSEANTFKLTDSCYGEGRAPASGVKKSGVNKTASLRGDLYKSLPDVDKSREPARSEARTAATRPEPRAPGNPPDGSLALAGAAAGGRSATSVPNPEGGAQVDIEEFIAVEKSKFRFKENYPCPTT